MRGRGIGRAGGACPPLDGWRRFRGAARKARALRQWWDAVEHLYAERILAFDLAAATVAGAMMDRARGAGQAPGFADVAIAATAEARGLTSLTRNVRHFRAVYARVLNPIERRLPPVASPP